jgi:hypothetical protein
MSIILVESLAGVRLMGVCLKALRFFNLGFGGKVKATPSESALFFSENCAIRSPIKQIQQQNLEI